jgi:hypothetical protein
MSGTMRRRPPGKRQAFYRDFANRDDKQARKIKEQQKREVARARHRLAAIQRRLDAPEP